MFEKEAEEILNKHCDCELLSECLEGIRTRCSDFEEQKKLLLEGIKFGYNKANEWHYVKDGDLPKDMENVLINAFDYGINTCYVAHRLNGKWKSNCSSEIFVHVIAWKEIVLPELPKESK